MVTVRHDLFASFQQATQAMSKSSGRRQGGTQAHPEQSSPLDPSAACQSGWDCLHRRRCLAPVRRLCWAAASWASSIMPRDFSASSCCRSCCTCRQAAAKAGLRAVC